MILHASNYFQFSDGRVIHCVLCPAPSGYICHIQWINVKKKDIFGFSLTWRWWRFVQVKLYICLDEYSFKDIRTVSGCGITTSTAISNEQSISYMNERIKPAGNNPPTTRALSSRRSPVEQLICFCDLAGTLFPHRQCREKCHYALHASQFSKCTASSHSGAIFPAWFLNADPRVSFLLPLSPRLLL